MQNNIVITISREYGSGGRTIGKMLAKSLGIDFYDYKIIELAAKQSGLSEEFMQQTEEKASSGLLYSLSYLGGTLGYSMSLNDRVFVAQSNVIRQIAEKGPCVIVGRCADYILKDHPHCLHFFVHADLEKRVDLAVRMYDLPEEKAKEHVAKTDKQRETYYNHYTNYKWGTAEGYHLTVDSGLIGIEGSVEVMKSFMDHAEIAELEHTQSPNTQYLKLEKPKTLLGKNPNWNNADTYRITADTSVIGNKGSVAVFKTYMDERQKSKQEGRKIYADKD